jgi:polysaccharide chain length determinant protein (PEP-CTERM system associated)
MISGRKYSPEDIAHILWCRKWRLMAGLVLFTGLAYGVSLRLPDQFTSETLILVIPQRIPESYVRSTVTMRIEDRLRSISQEILSRSRLERVITEFDLYPEQRKTRPMEVVVEGMRQNIVVETVKDDAFKVSFTAPQARTAMIVTDRLASMFIDENSQDRSAMAEGTNQVLESQLDDARRRLIAHEHRLEEFRRRNAGELPSQLQTNMQVIQGNQGQILNLNESINRDRDRRLVIEKAIADVMAGNTPTTAPVVEAGSSPESTTIGDGRSVDQLEKARNELRSLELRLKPEHPDVLAKKRQLAEIERKMQQEAATAPTPQNAQGTRSSQPSGNVINTAELVRQSRTRQYQAEIDKLDRQIASKENDAAKLRQAITDYQRRVDAVPGHESELTDLMRDYETLQKIYSNLLAKKEDSKISANLERQQVSEQFKILDPARLPEKPSSPNRLRIGLMGAVLGLSLGLGLLGFVEYRDTSLRSEDEILRTLVLPVLAAIPIMTAAADRRRRRRLMIASIAVVILAVAGAVAASVWHFGLLNGGR